MSVLEKNFDEKVNHCSPIQKDFERVVNYDADGNEIITYEEVDYPAIQARNGLAGDWSLDSLLKAGINPNFTIHTGNPTRLEGINVLNEASAIADEILSEVENKDE